MLVKGATGDKPMFTYHNLDHEEMLQWNEIQKFYFKEMHLKMAFGNMAAVFSQPQCVNYDLDNKQPVCVCIAQKCSAWHLWSDDLK